MQIISQKEAFDTGLTFYFTGKPCSRGHVEKRYVTSRGCVKCSDIAHKKRPKQVIDPLYSTLHNMKARCYNEDTPQYSDYGGRGIEICDRWLDPVHGFSNFCKDMGPRPEGYSIDRIDPDGDYCPENCKWASRTEQQRNKRATKVPFDRVSEIFSKLDSGESLADIARHFNCTRQNVWHIKKARHIYETGTA